MLSFKEERIIESNSILQKVAKEEYNCQHCSNVKYTPDNEAVKSVIQKLTNNFM